MMLMLISGIHHIAAILQALQKILYGKGGRLPIIIHADQNVSLHLMESGHQSRMLPEIPCQIHAAYVFLRPAELPDHLKGIIRRTVIHQYDFPLIFIPDFFHFPFDIRYHTA